MERVFIGLGSNVGDCLAHLRFAAGAISRMPQTRLWALSSIRQTRPVGPPQPDYFNAVALAHTDLDVADLLARLKALEQERGRAVSSERWGPRELDLDVLFYGELCLDGSMTVPHPQAHLRRFVLEPLVELDPHGTHPRLRRTFAELLRDYAGDEPPGQVRCASADWLPNQVQAAGVR
jgi:2-amino-4-hydroxy-6-hydroxymethyldihydropteridine diphosphokinase